MLTIFIQNQNTDIFRRRKKSVQNHGSKFVSISHQFTLVKCDNEFHGMVELSVYICKSELWTMRFNEFSSTSSGFVNAKVMQVIRLLDSNTK